MIIEHYNRLLPARCTARSTHTERVAQQRKLSASDSKEAVTSANLNPLQISCLRAMRNASPEAKNSF